MKNYENKLFVCAGVREVELFKGKTDTNADMNTDTYVDTVSVIPVIFRNVRSFIGIVRTDGVIRYLEKFELDSASGFFKRAERYCCNTDINQTSFFGLKNKLKNELSGKKFYRCDCSNGCYTVYSDDAQTCEVQTYNFSYADFFKTDTSDGGNTESLRKCIAKQLFLTMSFSEAIIEKLQKNPLIVGILKHNGGNDLLCFIWNCVKGKSDACSIVNPKESHSRLESNNLFSCKAGKKTSEFFETVQYILSDYIGSYMFSFDSGAVFPFSIKSSPALKYKTVLIQEDFDFSEEESDDFYCAIEHTNYLCMLKKYIQSVDLAGEYNECVKAAEAADYSNCLIKEYMPIIQLTAEKVNACFGMDLDVKAIQKLFAELVNSKKVDISEDPKDIMKKMIANLKDTDFCVAINAKGDKTCTKDREFVFIRYDAVKTALTKAIKGKGHIALLQTLAEGGYIAYGTRCRKDDMPRFESICNKEKVLRFYRNLYEECAYEQKFENNLLPRREAEAA
jgi:hypothetical protein